MTAITPLLAAPSMVMINVGANKGYNVNSFLHRYSNWLVTNPQWGAYLRALNMGFCGVCGACNETVLVRYGKAEVRVWAVELMSQNAALLESAFAHFAVPGRVIHAAGGETDGNTMEPTNTIDTFISMPGVEWMGVSTQGNHFPMVTVDSLVRQNQLSKVDMLSIDTEGHDAAVLRGAATALSQKMVRVVEFEYHAVGLWAVEKLGSTIDKMRRWGYECFWQSNWGELSPFLHQCRDLYEFRRWSNVVCSHDRDILRVLWMLVPDILQSTWRKPPRFEKGSINRGYQAPYHTRYARAMHEAPTRLDANKHTNTRTLYRRGLTRSLYSSS